MRKTIGAGGRARARAWAVVVLMGAALSAGGCGAATHSGGSGDPVASQSSRSPREVLLAAVPDGDEGRYRFTLQDHQGSPSGVVDPAAKSAQISTEMRDDEIGFVMHMAFRFVGDRTWIKMSYSHSKNISGLPQVPEKWLLLDPARLTDKDLATAQVGLADPGNAGMWLAGVATAAEDGPGRYRGTLDLTNDVDPDVVDAAALRAMGAAAKSVPFAATVNADGLLTSLRISLPAAGATKAYDCVITYTDYGIAPPVTAPSAAESQPAPGLVYEFLNG